MQEAQVELASLLAKDCRTLEDVEQRLKELFKGTVEQILEAEMDEHLGYQKHDGNGDNSGNSRNGYSTKTLKTKNGKAKVKVPRDRNAEFEPQIVRKYQTSASGIEDQVLSMYAKGVSTRDIESHLKEVYGIDVSASLVSRITDKIMPMVVEWQSRPLDRIYPIVYLDAVHFKVRQDSRIINKAAYTVMGITTGGFKEILGIWIGENESASFWLGVCNDLHSRGVEDILIVAKDNLSGFSDAINTVFPQTELQLCIIHQIRSSMKYVSWKDQKALMVDLKPVYKALTLEEAELRFSEFKGKWEKRYPLVVRSWERNWLELTSFFKYPPEIRRIIYTTNAIEGYHRQLRKVTRTKTAYPTDDALRKIIYLATQDIAKSWTMPVQDWGRCLSHMVIYFGERLASKIAF